MTSKHDEFLLDIRQGETILAKLTKHNSSSPQEREGELKLEGNIRKHINNYINRLNCGEINRDEMILLGETMYEELFPEKGGIRDLFEDAEKVARERFNADKKDSRLRVIIKVDHRLKDLLTWPIEFLHRTGPHGSFLSTTIHIALSRQISMPKLDITDQPDTPPLKVLIVTSSPDDLGEVMSAKTVEEIVLWAEKESLPGTTTTASRSDRSVTKTTGLQKPERDIRFLGEVKHFEKPPKSVKHYPDPATYQNIKAIGEDWCPHVLHFIGHGDILDKNGVIGLIKNEAENSVYWCQSDEFASLFASWQPRLVVLQACKGAQAITCTGFMSLASHLVQKAIPAVVAMQFEIKNEFATEFMSVFYRSLAEGLDIDAAVQDGRKDMNTLNNLLWKERHFGAPVLYMLSGNSIIRRDGSREIIEELRRDAEKYRKSQLFDLAREVLAKARKLEDELIEQESIHAKVTSQISQKNITQAIDSGLLGKK